jgi:riboflavin synthase
MFSGIVEERGTVAVSQDHRLEIACRIVPEDSAVGSSVAVSGVCLTVVARNPGSIGFDLSDETLGRSTLGGLSPGDHVNLERPVSLAARLGGHIVQGHVDGVGRVLEVAPEGEGGTRLRVEIPAPLRRYVVEKGSLTVDGVSLTVAEVHEDGVSLAVIPHTRTVTTLGAVGVGDPLNLEVDVIARYVERLMEGAST